MLLKIQVIGRLWFIDIMFIVIIPTIKDLDEKYHVSIESYF